MSLPTELRISFILKLKYNDVEATGASQEQYVTFGL